MVKSEEVLEGEIVAYEADDTGSAIQLAMYNRIDKYQKATVRKTLEEGQSLAVAARRAGINEQSLRNIITWAHNDPKCPAAYFVKQIDGLRAEQEAFAIERLKLIASETKDSKHIMKYLEVLDRERYGPAPNVTATQNNFHFGDLMKQLNGSSGPGD